MICDFILIDSCMTVHNPFWYHFHVCIRSQLENIWEKCNPEHFIANISEILVVVRLSGGASYSLGFLRCHQATYQAMPECHR